MNSKTNAKTTEFFRLFEGRDLSPKGPRKGGNEKRADCFQPTRFLRTHSGKSVLVALLAVFRKVET